MSYFVKRVFAPLAVHVLEAWGNVEVWGEWQSHWRPVWGFGGLACSRWVGNHALNLCGDRAQILGMAFLQLQ